MSGLSVSQSYLDAITASIVTNSSISTLSATLTSTVVNLASVSAVAYAAQTNLASLSGKVLHSSLSASMTGV